MPIFVNNKQIIDNKVIAALDESATILQGSSENKFLDNETIAIQTREAVLLRRNSKSPMGKLIKNIYSSGHTSCLLLLVEHINFDKIYVAHIDNSAEVDFSKIIELFTDDNTDDSKDFAIKIIYGDFSSVERDYDDIYIDRNFEVVKKKIKIKLISDTKQALNNVISSIKLFCNTEKKHNVYISAFKYKRSDFKAIDFVCSITSGIQIFPKNTELTLMGKYYPPANEITFLNEDKFNIIKFEAHMLYNYLSHLANNKILLIYNSDKPASQDSEIDYKLSRGNRKIRELLNYSTFDLLVSELISLNKTLCGENELSKAFLEDSRRIIFSFQEKYQDSKRHVKINVNARNLNPKYLSLLDKIESSLEIAEQKEAKISGELFKGMFSYPNKQHKKLKEQLKQRYNLSDDSLPELEKGLRRAVIRKQAADIPYFIKVGVHIDAANEEGKTALHYAVEKKLITCVQTLLCHGAKYNIPDNSSDKKTAFDCAQEINDSEILNLFPDKVPKQ